MSRSRLLVRAACGDIVAGRGWRGGRSSRRCGAVAQAMGPVWVRAQRAAFGFAGEDLSTTAAAALNLYRITAEQTRHLLTDDQQAVVAVALHAIEQLPAR